MMNDEWKHTGVTLPCLGGGSVRPPRIIQHSSFIIS
jgi:hypothetical protein